MMLSEAVELAQSGSPYKEIWTLFYILGGPAPDKSWITAVLCKTEADLG